MKRKLSLLMVLMMVLTLIPAMPSFAAGPTLTEDVYSSTDLDTPNGFWPATSQAQAESVRQGGETKVKILEAVDTTTFPAFEAIANSQVTFQLADKDEFTEFRAFVNGSATPLAASRVDMDEDDNYVAIDLQTGDVLDRVEFRVELAKEATGRRIIEVKFPEGNNYTSVRDLRYVYAQTAGTALGSVNRLTKVEEWTPNNAWRTIKGARFNIVNPEVYTDNVFVRENREDAIELRLSTDFNWVVGDQGTRIFIDGVEFDYMTAPNVDGVQFLDTDKATVNRDRNILTIFPSQNLADPDDYTGLVTVEVVPVFSLTRDARLGQEVVVDVDSAEATGSVVIAKYVDFTTGITVEDVREILAGTAKENKDYRVKITLEDNSLGLASLRDIDMTFANGTAKLIRAEGIDRTKVDGFRQGSRVPVGIENLVQTNGTVRTQEADYADTFQFTTVNQANNTEVINDQDEIVLEFYLRADNNAGGKDMTVNVTGRGLDYKDVKVATVIAPVEMTVDEVKNVELGLQAQESGTLVLAESKAGALERGREYEIVLNDTDSSVATGTIKVLDGYKVEVADGNGLNIRTSVAEGKLRFTVLRESITNPAKITISNMRITADRNVAYGDIKAELVPLNDRTFTAYNLGYRDVVNGVNSDFTLIDPRTVDVDRTKTILASVKYMKLATEAPTTVRKETVFTIGSTSFTVGGQAMTLDAAPYISNNRTMLPIGTVAQLVGATVNYDSMTRTAVFQNDKTTVSMNLDTNMLLVNGSSVPMDAKPEIQNSRAFVSLVYVAQAFGIQNGTDIVYDAAANTVTLFPNVQ